MLEAGEVVVFSAPVVRVLATVRLELKRNTLKCSFFLLHSGGR